MLDVFVVGGGPAGLVAARDLARAGHRVRLCEEHPAVGVPVHCTGLLGADVFGELDLPRASILRTLQAARFHASTGRSVLVESDRIRATVVDRASFDAALAGEAAAAGVRIDTGVRVTSISHAVGGVRATAADGRTVAARACVLACGASYRFNRTLGLGVPRLFMQSAQLELPFPAVQDVQVFLGHEVAPDGFGWLVPFERRGAPYARIGLMCRTRALNRFETLASALAREYGYAGDVPRPRLKVLPLAPVSKTYTDRIVAVGDAAGLVKPTTGGGIYYSLLSGQIAAAVLDRGLREDALEEASLREYESRWRARLGPEIRAGLAFRTLVSRLNDRAIDAVVELASVDGLVPLLRQTADFNWHRTAVLALLKHAGFRKILLSAIWT
ncbi:MAG: NAD(P)/FAD-dependent oxidoreductase [Acidobacteria bacterium]|nr:NAD(P)/FAD-dependent oxidoreductase [Acidobacteriota bacterium]